MWWLCIAGIQELLLTATCTRHPVHPRDVANKDDRAATQVRVPQATIAFTSVGTRCVLSTPVAPVVLETLCVLSTPVAPVVLETVQCEEVASAN
jgi:hypothetical protein